MGLGLVSVRASCVGQLGVTVGKHSIGVFRAGQDSYAVRNRSADQAGYQLRAQVVRAVGQPGHARPADAPEEAEAGRTAANPCVPAAPLNLADAASHLGIRPVELAQAVREGKMAPVRALVGREDA